MLKQQCRSPATDPAHVSLLAAAGMNAQSSASTTAPIAILEFLSCRFLAAIDHVHVKK